MNDHEEWSELADEDRLLLKTIEAVVANRGRGDHAGTALGDFGVQLLNAVPPANEAFRRELRSRLLAEMAQQQEEVMSTNSEQKPSGPVARPSAARPRRRAALAVALVVVVLLAGVVLFYPPARAWAQQILARFGPFAFTNAPTLPELALTQTPELPPTPEATPAEASGGRQHASTVEEARRLASFGVLSPAYVPEGYHLQNLDAWPSHDGGTLEITTNYISGQELLMIRQIAYTPSPDAGEAVFPIGDVPVVEVTVRGQKGVWVEKAKLGQHTNEDGTVQLTEWSMLMWQEQRQDGHFLFWFYTNALSREEMLKIAESLSK